MGAVPVDGRPIARLYPAGWEHPHSKAGTKVMPGCGGQRGPITAQCLSPRSATGPSATVGTECGTPAALRDDFWRASER